MIYVLGIFVSGLNRRRIADLQCSVYGVWSRLICVVAENCYFNATNAKFGFRYRES